MERVRQSKPHQNREESFRQLVPNICITCITTSWEPALPDIWEPTTDGHYTQRGCQLLFPRPRSLRRGPFPTLVEWALGGISSSVQQILTVPKNIVQLNAPYTTFFPKNIEKKSRTCRQNLTSSGHYSTAPYKRAEQEQNRPIKLSNNFPGCIHRLCELYPGNGVSELVACSDGLLRRIVS